MTIRAQALLLLLLAVAAPAAAQVYRWVDGKGTVHYSNATPPPGVKATMIEPESKPGAPSPESLECHTVRCQGERMEKRLVQRAETEARLAAERAAAAPPQARGLDFRDYLSLYRGMSEGELVSIAGPADLVFSDIFADKRYTYLATSANPWITTVSVVGGRVNHIERVQQFK